MVNLSRNLKSGFKAWLCLKAVLIHENILLPRKSKKRSESILQGLVKGVICLVLFSLSWFLFFPKINEIN